MVIRVYRTIGSIDICDEETTQNSMHWILSQYTGKEQHSEESKHSPSGASIKYSNSDSDDHL